MGRGGQEPCSVKQLKHVCIIVRQVLGLCFWRLEGGWGLVISSRKVFRETIGVPSRRPLQRHETRAHHTQTHSPCTKTREKQQTIPLRGNALRRLGVTGCSSLFRDLSFVVVKVLIGVLWFREPLILSRRLPKVRFRCESQGRSLDLLRCTVSLRGL